MKKLLSLLMVMLFAVNAFAAEDVKKVLSCLIIPTPSSYNSAYGLWGSRLKHQRPHSHVSYKSLSPGNQRYRGGLD